MLNEQGIVGTEFRAPTSRGGRTNLIIPPLLRCKSSEERQGHVDQQGIVGTKSGAKSRRKNKLIIPPPSSSGPSRVKKRVQHESTNKAEHSFGPRQVRRRRNKLIIPPPPPPDRVE
jgi:hypothetical protein